MEIDGFPASEFQPDPREQKENPEACKLTQILS